MEHKLVLIALYNGVVTHCLVYPYSKVGILACENKFKDIVLERGKYTSQEIEDMDGAYVDDNGNDVLIIETQNAQ